MKTSKKLLTYLGMAFAFLVMASQTFAQTTSVSISTSVDESSYAPAGFTWQKGLGNNDNLNWTDPYTTKFSIWDSKWRAFEISTTSADNGFKARVHNGSANQWDAWRNFVMEDANGDVDIPGKLFLGDGGIELEGTGSGGFYLRDANGIVIAYNPVSTNMTIDKTTYFEHDAVVKGAIKSYPGANLDLKYDDNTRISVRANSVNFFKPIITDQSVQAHNPNGSGQVKMDFYNDVSRLRFGGSGYTNGFAIQGTGNTTHLRVLDNGNVGIGTDTPSTKLEVAGDLNVTGKIRMGGDVVLSEVTNNTRQFGSTLNVHKPMSFPEDVTIGTADLVAGTVLTVDGRVYISEEGGTEAGFDDQTSENYEDYLLWVEEGIVSTDFAIAETSDWPDYVFEEEYQLSSMEELENHIIEEGHLPNFPSAEEVQTMGYTLDDMTKRLVRTVEEMTLHNIAQEKLIKSLMSRLDALEANK